VPPNPGNGFWQRAEQEWHHGFGAARFGLVGFDPTTQARSVKASGRWLAGLIRDGVLDPARIP
jgi:beta-glucosidase/6-phospho-beta-glucosidase/beta-galactosidase